MSSQTFRLIELTFALLQTMKRDGHNHIPALLAQRRRGPVNKQSGQERLEPQRTLIFVAVNDFPDHAAGRDRGARMAKVQLQFPAVTALKRRGEIDLKG